MSSVSFDPLAHIYDATRGYPESVAQKIALGIKKTVSAVDQTTFLEVGIGTGRIALPLTSLGHTYTGVDISEKMVEVLEAKLRAEHWWESEQPWGTLPDENALYPSEVYRFVQNEKQASMRLVLSDMTRLPFHSASFDAVVAVHVFHLVDGWQKALEEVLRVLRAGGLFLHGWDEHVISDVRRIEEEWRKILQSLGGKINRPGTSSRFLVSDFLHKKGFQSEEITIAEWDSIITPRQVVEYITGRIWSSTLSIPDDIFVASSNRLWTWANKYYGTKIDEKHTQGRRFVISKIRV